MSKLRCTVAIPLVVSLLVFGAPGSSFAAPAEPGVEATSSATPSSQSAASTVPEPPSAPMVAAEPGPEPAAGADSLPPRAADVPLNVEPAIPYVPAPEPEPVPEPAPLEIGIAPEPDDDGGGFAEEPLDDTDSEPFDDYDPLVDSPEALRARHWIRAGAVLVPLGAVLAIGGAAMGAVRDPCKQSAGNGCQADAQRRAALTLAVPGSIFILGGIAAIAVGETQKKRLRASVEVSRRGAVLGLSGRF